MSENLYSGYQIGVVKLEGWADDIAEQKVRIIQQIIKQSYLTPIVRLTTARIIREAGVKENDRLGILKAVFEWVQKHIYYLPEKPETFYKPERMLELIEKEGQVSVDCDDATILLGSMLYTVGFKVAPVIMVSTWNVRNTYNHIFLQVRLGGKWLSLDATAKDKGFLYKPTWRRAKRFPI